MALIIQCSLIVGFSPSRCYDVFRYGDRRRHGGGAHGVCGGGGGGAGEVWWLVHTLADLPSNSSTFVSPVTPSLIREINNISIDTRYYI